MAWTLTEPSTSALPEAENEVSELIANLTAAPVLPATCLLGLLVVWSLWSLIGGLDLSVDGASTDFGSADADMPTANEALSGMAMTMLKALNLRDVPLIIWGGAFAVVYWLVSINVWIFLDSRVFTEQGFVLVGVMIVRNLIFSTVITKFVTQPLCGKFTSEAVSDPDIIGGECEISTLDATPEFGQAKFPTGGSPLLLNIRTDGPHLHKGDRVWITHYDAERRVYVVSPTTGSISDVSSTPQSREIEND